MSPTLSAPCDRVDRDAVGVGVVALEVVVRALVERESEVRPEAGGRRRRWCRRRGCPCAPRRSQARRRSPTGTGFSHVKGGSRPGTRLSCPLMIAESKFWPAMFARADVGAARRRQVAQIITAHREHLEAHELRGLLDVAARLDGERLAGRPSGADVPDRRLAGDAEARLAALEVAAGDAAQVLEVAAGAVALPTVELAAAERRRPVGLGLQGSPCPASGPSRPTSGTRRRGSRCGSSAAARTAGRAPRARRRSATAAARGPTGGSRSTLSSASAKNGRPGQSCSRRRARSARCRCSTPWGRSPVALPA